MDTSTLADLASAFRIIGYGVGIGVGFSGVLIGAIVAVSAHDKRQLRKATREMLAEAEAAKCGA